MRKDKLLGNFILLLTAFIWGMSFAFQKEGVTAIPPFTFGASRCVLSAISVWIVAILFERGKTRTKEYKRTTIKGGLICGVFLTIACNLQQIGLVHTSAGKGAFITALYMLLIPIIGVLFLKQKIGKRAWLAVAIGVAGMYLLCISSDFTIGSGDIYVLGCAVFFSLQMLAVDKYAPNANPLFMSAIQFTMNAVISGTIAFIFEHPNFADIKGVAVEVLYCGLFSGGLGYTLQMVGQRMTDPTSAGLLLSFESVFGALGGALMLNERMTVRELLGAVIMFFAIMLIQLPGKKQTDCFGSNDPRNDIIASEGPAVIASEGPAVIASEAKQSNKISSHSLDEKEKQNE